MKKYIKGIVLVIASTLILSLAACGKDEYSDGPVSEEVNELNSERVREETAEELKNTYKRQAEIAKAKVEVQKQRPNSELIISDNVGQVGVASLKREGTLIPTYIFLPENFKTEKSYPMVIMFSGFSADHNNGTRFDYITAEFTKNGIIVVQYDNPGYGNSEETNLAYTLSNMKDDAVDVVNYVRDTFNISKIGAFGYDVGGRVAMELQVDKMIDFDQIELLAPFSETSEFIHACFGEENWNTLKAKAIEQGMVKYGQQEYSKQWFLDWEENDMNLAEDFILAYKNRRCMIIYATDDDWVKMTTMDSLSNKLGAASIYVTSGGHDLGVRNYETPKDVSEAVKKQSVDFMKGLNQ